ncbi:MAG: pilus assembly protein [Acidimicrobiia bacterium]
MRKTLTLLVVSLLVLAPGGTQADTDDLFALSLRPNVLILIDGSGSMDNTDSGAYSVSYGVDLNGNGNVSCPGSECVADLDVDGVDSTRNDVALNVVLDLLDANKDGLVDVKDENLLAVRLGLMYYTAGGDNDDTPRPRVEIEYSFETIAPVGTPYANIKKAITDPIIAGTPDINIVVSTLRGCTAAGSECSGGGYKLNDTPTAESLQYLEHYWWPEQLAADPDGVCRQNFIIMITDGASDGFTPTETVAASLYNAGTPKTHGLGVPEGFKDRFGNLIPVPKTTFTYEFTDKDSQVLIREFTKQFTAGVTFVDVKLASTVPGATPPASCLADCFAYDPNGGDATSIPPTDLGYVGGLDSATYGSGTALTSLTYVSGNVLDPEPSYFAKTFAVGFVAGDPVEVDAVAASGGSGTGFFPGNFAELSNAVMGAIVKIQAETLSIAAPAVPAARSVSGNALYLASFTPSDNPFWYGELTAYPLNSDGSIQTDANGKITAPPLWEAHTVLNGTPTNSRNIKTVLNGSLDDFKGPKNALTTALNVSQDFDGNGILNSNDADSLIDYVRGADVFDEDKDGNVVEDRAWKLGDIYHSSPVVIGPPGIAYIDLNLDRTVDTSFPVFRTTFATRDRVLYTGSNGGMLHAFHAGAWTGTDYDTGSGAERWGFIPPNLLPKLEDMVNQHIPLVDGPPSAADVWLDGMSNDGAPAFADGVKAANEWHTVLVTGERRGGNAYFALDVTNPGIATSPNDPGYLWEFSDTELGETWSRAAIGKVRLSLNNGATTIERWVAFVGGGYLPSSDTSSIGKAFFVIDMNTGTKLWEYTVTGGVGGGDDDDDDAGGGLSATMGRIPAAPTPVDTDGDGFVDRVYVGDLDGNIWRFDMQAVGTTSGLGTLVTGWKRSKLFAASSGRPFYDRLAVATDPIGRLWVYGGTGDLDDLLNNTSVDRFYAIQEAYPKATGTPPPPFSVPAVVTDADLADTTGLNTLNVYDPAFSGKLGWYLTLSPGEKILSDPDIFAGVLLITSFLPTQATCTEKGGNTTLYALSYLTGGGASDWDAYKQGVAGNKVAASIGGFSSGAKVSLPGRTATGASTGGDVVLFVCTSGKVCGNPPAPQPGSLRSIDYWRDL